MRDHDIDEQEKACASSYVRFDTKWWNVSTIYRESSAMIPGMWYFETLVWEWDPKTKQRGALVYQGEGYGDHVATVERLFRTGSPEVSDHD